MWTLRNGYVERQEDLQERRSHREVTSKTVGSRTLKESETAGGSKVWVAPGRWRTRENQKVRVVRL